MNIKGIIYKVTSPGGKVYIGKTTRGFEERRKRHEQVSKYGSLFHFHRAIRKYGDLMFWEIIDEAGNENDLALLEMFYIEQENSFHFGYNMTLGGEGNRKYKTLEESAKANKAKAKVYSQRPETKAYKKAYMKIYQKMPKVIAKQKIYQEIPEVKARRKAKKKIHNQTLKVKVQQKAYRQTLKYKTYKKAYDQRPEVKARKKASRLKNKNKHKDNL